MTQDKADITHTVKTFRHKSDDILSPPRKIRSRVRKTIKEPQRDICYRSEDPVEIQYIQDLLLLSQAATALVELPFDGDLYQLIARQLEKLTAGKVYIIVSSFDESSNTVKVQSFLGPSKDLSALNSILGRVPSGMSMPLNKNIRKKLSTGKLECVLGGKMPSPGSVIPEQASRMIEDLLIISCSYVMGFYWEGKLYGTVTILVPAGSEVRNLQIVETFIRQASIALQRKQALEALAKAKEELETRVSERTAALTEANAKLKLEISVRQQIEEGIRNLESFNTILMGNAPNPIVVYSPDLTIMFVNKALEDLTGFSSGELVGQKPPLPFWPPGRVKEYSRLFNRIRLRTIHREERLFQKKNGEPFWVEVTSNFIFDFRGSKIAFLAIWLDISERKKAEEQLLIYQQELRSLASRLILAEQNERRNIATLIHAGVTQLLALAVMKMESLKKNITDPDIFKSLDEVHKIVQQSIEDTRNLTFELSPPSLYDFGLEAALEELIERFGENQGIKTSYDDDGKTKNLNESTSVLLFQAVRELLHNVTTHSKASRVWVFSKIVVDSIQITVKDNGIGFTTTSLKESSGDDNQLGLFGIRERLRYIGGQLRIESQPGKGSSIILIAPLERTQ